jgi:hypothetical protein
VPIDIEITGNPETDPTGSSKTRKFKVSSKGLLTAENAYIRGTIFASEGEIGAWTINNNLQSLNNSKYTIIKPNGQVAIAFGVPQASWNSNTTTGA